MAARGFGDFGVRRDEMNLQLAVVSLCSQTGCQARLLDDDVPIDTNYCEKIRRLDINNASPGDLVAVDCETEPPQTVF